MSPLAPTSSLSTHFVVTRDLQNTFVALERSLLDPVVRRDPIALDALLDDDVIEVGASGKTYRKHDMVAALAGESNGVRTLTDVQAMAVRDDVVLVHFVATHTDGAGRVRRSQRTSLWVRVHDRWRLRFHQGTPLSP